MTIAMTRVLPEPVAILAQSRRNSPAVRRNVDADFLGVGRFGQPDQSLDGFKLAEEKPPALEILRVGPVFEKALGDAVTPG